MASVDFDDFDLTSELTPEELAELNSDLDDMDEKDSSPSSSLLEDEFAAYLSQPSPKREKKAPEAPAAPVTLKAEVVTETPSEEGDDLESAIAEFLEEDSAEASFEAEEEMVEDDFTEESDPVDEGDVEYSDLEEVEAFLEEDEVAPWDEIEDSEEESSEPVGDDLDEALAAFEETDAALADVEVTLPDPSEEELPEGEVTEEILTEENVEAVLAEEVVVDNEVVAEAGDVVILNPTEEPQPSLDLEALLKAAVDAQQQLVLEYNRQTKALAHKRSLALLSLSNYVNSLMGQDESAMPDLKEFHKNFTSTQAVLQDIEVEMLRLQDLADKADTLSGAVNMARKVPVNFDFTPTSTPSNQQPVQKAKTPKVQTEAVSLSDLQPDMVIKGKLVGGEAGRVRKIKIVSVDETGAKGVYLGPGAIWETNVAPVILETVRLMPAE